MKISDIVNEALETTLNGAIGPTDTSLVVASAPGLVGTFRVWIGSEMIIVRNPSGATLGSLIRGAEGTIAAAHGDGDKVIFPRVPAGNSLGAGAILEMLWRGTGGGSSSPLTMKGDVWGYDSADARIPVGTDDYVLTADSAEALGVKWAPAPASGSGNSDIVTGTVAARPSPGFSGRLYLPTDGFEVYRDNGSAWKGFGPVFPFTEPVDGDFAWVNQGGASVDTTYGGIHLVAPLNSGASWRIRKKSAPGSTPWTITAFILPVTFAIDVQSVGLIFRESSSGKCISCGIVHATNVLRFQVAYLNSATSVNSVIVNRDVRFPQHWLRIADTGSLRKFFVSANGQHWEEIYSETRTNFITANEVGFFANEESNVQQSQMTLLSWKEA